MTKITQAMILAAGKGTRMRPLTLHTPKPLVLVADKPLIVWHIQRLRDAGVTDIVINVGYLGQQIIQALTAMSLGVNLHISDESGLIEPLETAGGIKYALANGLLDDEPFILVNGDVWTEYDFGQLINHDLQDNLAHLVLVDNPDYHSTGDFLFDGSRVGLKNDDWSSYTFAGLSILSPKIVCDITVGEVAPLAPLLKSAMMDDLVTGELMTQKWIDVGTVERLAYINKYAKNI